MAPPTDILLVDDEPRNLDALEAILAEPSYRLLRATDADQALHLLLENDVAAIVLDIKMPGTSGLELAQLIKNTNRFRETPIVFLTAYLLDEQHITAGYNAGGVDYLTKPVNPQILRHKIAVFAELFRKTRELAALNKTLEERVRDRTVELERSEASLRAAARQKDEFLAVLAHELRNPLAPLRTGLDLLLRKESPRPGDAKVLTAMDRQLLHMVRLIDDLLDVSRISRGALELKKEVVELGALVQATVDSARPLFERRKQTVVTTVARDVWVRADPTRTAQIVTNLLTNSAKFTPEEGRIAVDLSREAGQVVVRVVDSGPGIPGDQLERIFDMFTRLERPGVGTGAGLGIGLALARRLAEMHEGTLKVSSEGAGCGATFALALPALPAAATPAVGMKTTSDAARPTVSSGLRILVIEDNEDVADTLTMLLEEMGHHVSLARTGQGGIDLFRSTLPDVVLCDLGLPGMGGEEVCRQVRALPKAVEPVMVAITGWGRQEDRLRTREAGFDHHLVKPVTIESLDGVLVAVAP